MIAVSTPTQKSFNTLMEAYEKKGYVWASYQKPTVYLELWKDFESKTCVSFQDNFGYCNKQYYKNRGYEIIPVKEALKRLKKDVCPHCGK